MAPQSNSPDQRREVVIISNVVILTADSWQTPGSVPNL